MEIMFIIDNHFCNVKYGAQSEFNSLFTVLKINWYYRVWGRQVEAIIYNLLLIVYIYLQYLLFDFLHTDDYFRFLLADIRTRKML